MPRKGDEKMFRDVRFLHPAANIQRTDPTARIEEEEEGFVTSKDFFDRTWEGVIVCDRGYIGGG